MATATAKNRNWYKRNEIAVTPWVFLIPGIFMFSLYVIYPIFQSFRISFHEWDGLGEKTWVGLANYERLLGGDRKFETSFWNNIRWLVLYLLAIPMGLFISLFLNQKVFGIRLYKSLFFFPFVISQVVVGLVFSWFYLPNDGLFDVLVSKIGIDISGGILGNPNTATYGIIAAGLWPQTAYCMILYLTGLNAVDPEQVEAARLDGAKGARMLWYVILPQLKPATFIAFVVTIIG
jgi:multiple sugar transport system permease protein